MTLDIVILTKNEARNIMPCLASFRGLGQALVIDDGSTDETVALARGAGAVVHGRAMDDFSGQRNYALAVSTADWVFFLDADERFTPGLAEAVARHVREGGGSAGRALRRNFAFGRRFRFGHLAPDWVPRLFPRGAVEWAGRVHETPVTDLPLATLSGFLEHHTYRSWEHFLTKMERYARIWAAEAAGKGRGCGVSTALAKGLANFAKTAILKLGFLDGPVGVAVSAVSAYYTLSKYLILSGLGRGDGG
jgi:glycosyltransferase involved in cell wall biosynthesis